MTQKKGGFNRYLQDKAACCDWSSGVSRHCHLLKMGCLNQLSIVISLSVGYAAIAATQHHLDTVSPQRNAHRAEVRCDALDQRDVCVAITLGYWFIWAIAFIQTSYCACGFVWALTAPHRHRDGWFNRKVIDPMTFLAQKTYSSVAEGTLLSPICTVSPEQASLKLQ